MNEPTGTLGHREGEKETGVETKRLTVGEAGDKVAYTAFMLGLAAVIAAAQFQFGHLF